MLLGLAAGKVGDLVFYRDGGEQRTRTRVIPKNPRSPLQMAQRVRIANVSAMYRLLAPIVRDSFSNRPSNQSGYNAMASSAIELSPYLTREMANADAVIPMPAVISRGILSALPLEIGANGVYAALLPVAGWDDSAPSTVGALSALILDAYPALQNGDILTFVGLNFSQSEAGEVDVYNAVSDFKSLTLDSTSEEPLPTGFNAPSTAGQLPVAVFSEGSSAESVVAAGVVVSRVDESGSLQTSFSRLLLNAPAQSLYDGYRTEQALQDAIISYNVGSESILR